ncbi:MAG: hypothetical protein AAB091_01035, partial [Elusimicrobiota bacterium]
KKELCVRTLLYNDPFGSPSLGQMQGAPSAAYPQRYASEGATPQMAQNRLSKCIVNSFPLP